MQADIGRLAGATETGVIVPVAAEERAVGLAAISGLSALSRRTS
jgi:hypothetical protein